MGASFGKILNAIFPPLKLIRQLCSVTCFGSRTFVKDGADRVGVMVRQTLLGKYYFGWIGY